MITLKNVILRRGAKVLLDGASVTFNPGEKVGLVGRNGAGKSTLFALSQRHAARRRRRLLDCRSSGAWRRSRRTCPRPTSPPPTSWSAATRAWSSCARRWPSPKPAARPTDDTKAWRLAHAYTDLADAGEHDAVPRAQALILGLGFKTHELDQPVNSFSGGWRMRLQLARALMCPIRPAAARRADQPPGPRRARLAGSLAAERTPAR